MFHKFRISALTVTVYILISFAVFSLYSFIWQNNEVKLLKEQNKKILLDFAETQTKNQTEIFKLNQSISILDAAIEPDNKRWARIKQVRKIVVDVLRQQGTKSLTILEITEISRAVIQSSEENDVSVSLILAVMTVESAFKINAISKANARGLMQLLPETASEIAAEINKRNFNLFKIKDNIQLGSYYLWKMNNLFGNLDLAISAYNCGPVCVERVQSGEYSSYPRETIEYLKKVNEWKLKYDDLGVD